MGIRGKRNDSDGHAVRSAIRRREHAQPGALDGLKQQEALAAPVSTAELLPAVDLTEGGIVESRRKLAGFTDVGRFFEEQVRWLKKPRQLKVLTRSNRAVVIKPVKIIGIVQNGNPKSGGSIIIDVTNISPGRPMVANRFVLLDPADWEEICQAPKQAQPAAVH